MDMNKIKLACFTSLLAASIAQASTPCNGFEIKVKNNLANDLVVNSIQLNGAELQPGGIQKISKRTEQVFTVNNSSEEGTMAGKLLLRTLSLPSKEVKIEFDLKNAGVVCEHTEHSPAGDYAVENVRVPGGVNYSVSNK